MRRTMKKILLAVAFVAVAFSASAWNRQQDEAVVIAASKHLTPKAKMVVDGYLGTDYADDLVYIYNLERRKRSPYSTEVHYIHLDDKLQIIAGDGDDAVRAIEEALAIIKKGTGSRHEITNAFRTIICLMCDMHCLSNVRLSNVPHSQSDFDVQVQRTASGPKMKEVSRVKWSKFWGGYNGHHKGFFAELWAEEMEVCHGADYAQITKGGLRDWASRNGAIAADLYTRINPTNAVTRVEFLKLEELHFEMMATAGFRLAALLNDTIK